MALPSTKHLNILIIFFLMICAQTFFGTSAKTADTNIADNKVKSSGSIKKELINSNPHATNSDPRESHLMPAQNTVDEKPKADDSNKKASSPEVVDAQPAPVIPPEKQVVANNHLPAVEESTFKHKKIHNEDDEFPDSYQRGFYFFLALSTAGIILIVVKIYRMRMSRAERRYGVQSDRSTQELTPLPVAIEDGNSDEEDQTLFDRQQIRIL